MKNVLMVPVHLDALHLAGDELVHEATADFSLLPFSDGVRDVNADTPNISEAVVSNPFQDEGLNLKAGIHLHWALPDALTKGAQGTDGTEFPAVPNRWLVTRSRRGEGGAFVAEKQWVVESDYLYPEGAGALAGGVSIPHRPAEGEYSPFRFMGRNMPLAAWREVGAGAERMEKLTAVGYGEPTFAAFYPNCHSVFGFYDGDYAGAVPEGLRYDLIGWYADPAADRVKTFVDDFAQAQREAGAGEPSDEQLKDAMKSELGWTLTEGTSGEFPAGMLCYARLVFEPDADAADNPAAADQNTGVTVANTGTEALSAYLADAVDPGRKAELEDQLEALLLSSRLDNRQLDVGPKFEELRQEKGFTAIAAGTLWSITSESTTAAPADASRADAQTQVTLPETLAHSLNDLNSAQHTYDRALERLESERGQLFSDWYKYMVSAYPPEDARDDYPDVDEVRNYIELKVLAPLLSRQESAGTLWLETDAGGVVSGADARDSSPASLAALLAAEVNALLSALATHNRSEEVVKAGLTYRLRQVPGPRYYRPTDPVVLLTGPAVKPTERHGQDGRLRDDGLLECQFFQSDDAAPLVPDQLAALTARLDQLQAEPGDESIAFDTWDGQPWHPFLLEWEAEFFPVDAGSNLDPDTGHYSHDYITGNYLMAENEVDFSVRAGSGTVTKAATVYDGRTVLTPYAAGNLKAQIEAYLREQTLDDYLRAHELPQPEQPDDYFLENRTAILDWYSQQNCNADQPSATCQIIRAYQHLDAPDFYSLSQSLGGFNDALLMRRRTMQLDIADPLGFTDYRPFTDAVRDAVAGRNLTAPRPLSGFTPVRAGALKILRLRLVDTFGRAREVDCGPVVTTEKLKVAGSPYAVTLPPRLAQPARLNFRWLSAESGEQEMNDHPATSPVCGWVLPNNLDNSLMVYDNNGRALGSIDQTARWQPAPGSEAPVAVEDIPNLYLKQMVAHLTARGPDFMEHFLTALDNALENIEPENFEQHQDLALLMGRPVALVRASVSLELQGAPAVHQGWNNFRLDMHRHRRDDTGFTHVRFPVRLGEYRQMNDGLVGYWREAAAGGYETDYFYAPQSEEVGHDLIKTHADTTDADDPLTLPQTAAAPPHVVAMLVDPRGSVHAASGVAPVKGISIPPDQYADALRAIEITFLSTPVLTDAARVRLPLPPESGFAWSWLRRETGAWSEISTSGTVKKQVFIDAFPGQGEALWGAMKEKGWVVEVDAATARVTPKDLRPSPTLGEAWAEQEPEVELLLAASYLGPVTQEANFSGQQTLLEGWLKLRPETTPATSK